MNFDDSLLRHIVSRTSAALLLFFLLIAMGSFLGVAPKLHASAGFGGLFSDGFPGGVSILDQGVADASNPGSSAGSPGEVNFNGSILFTLLLVSVLVVLFFLEPLPLYVLALSIPVFLVAFQPWTRVTPEEAISGFASKATITVLAMFILSEGVQKSGLIQILGDRLSQFTGPSEVRQLGAITGLSGPIAGIINNTPVVAIFIPMVSNIARKMKTSPSKLMIPLTYASMMGGTLTLIGSSTNLLASDISARLLDHPIAFFEFTGVGAVILVCGSLYLVTLGRYLTPERIDPEEDLPSEYEMGEFLTELTLHEKSDFVGRSVGETFEELDIDLDLVQIVRSEEQFMEPLQVKTLREDDRLIVRTSRNNLMEILTMEGVRIHSRSRVTESQLEEPVKGQTVIQTVIPTGSFLEDQTLKEVNFQRRYSATVLAIRRGEELTHTRMEEITIRAGDVLLLLVTENTLDRLRQNRNFIVEEEIRPSQFRRSKIPLVVGILLGVVLLAAIDVVSIVISALGGVLAMVATGCIKPNDLHEAVDWEVVFLLAGLIPLGVAMEKTGAAQFLAASMLGWTSGWPPLVVLGFFYLFTAAMTNLIHKNASVVLVIPIAVDAATQLGLAPFPFLVAVMLAASTAFLTPVGNHTNLMVYGPGGYRFSDFLRVGAPLQLLLAVVTPWAITWFWAL